jgi:sugar lactone lactonase YvrE
LIYVYDTSYGQQGTSGTNGNFITPMGVAISPDGTLIAVSDINYPNIQVFNGSGVYQYQISTSNSGNSNAPSSPGGIVFDENNNLYVADSGTTEVDVYALTSTAGTWTTYFVGDKDGIADLIGPKDVKLNNNGNLVVADWDPNVADSGYTYNVNVLTDKVISKSRGDGGGLNPVGCTVDSSGNIYVADQANDAIYVYNSDLKYQYNFNSSASIPAWPRALGAPWGITIDPEGFLIIGDNGNSPGQVVRTDIQGNYNQNIGVGEISYPDYMGFDPLGNLYVADAGDDAVLEFNP